MDNDDDMACNIVFNVLLCVNKHCYFILPPTALCFTPFETPECTEQFSCNFSFVAPKKKEVMGPFIKGTSMAIY